MSVGNVPFELQNAKFDAINSVPTPIITASDATYGKAIAFAIVKSSSTTSTENADVGKYAFGCLLLDQRDGSLWVNKAAITAAAAFGVIAST